MYIPELVPQVGDKLACHLNSIANDFGVPTLENQIGDNLTGIISVDARNHSFSFHELLLVFFFCLLTWPSPPLCLHGNLNQRAHSNRKFVG